MGQPPCEYNASDKWQPTTMSTDGTQLRPHERSLTNSAQVKASATQTDLTGP